MPIRQVFDESECVFPVGFLASVINACVVLFAVIIYGICFFLAKELCSQSIFYLHQQIQVIFCHENFGIF